MRLYKTFRGRAVAACLAVVLAAVALPNLARADNIDKLVSTTRASWTPIVDVGVWDPENGEDQLKEVWALEHGKNGVMYACGNFQQVREANGSWQPRKSVFAFYTSGENKGKLTSFAPSVIDQNAFNAFGTVNKCIISYDGKSLLLVGSFTHVNGQARKNIALVDLATGALKPFGASVDGNRIVDVQMAKDRYFIFGNFTTVNGHAQTGIASLTKEGEYSGYFSSQLTGKIAEKAGWTGAYRGAVKPDQSELVAIVNTDTIDGQNRRHLAKWDLKKNKAVLQNWVPTRAYSENCQKFMVVRDVAYTEKGNYFYTVATGGGAFKGLCDQTIKWKAADRGKNVKEVWRNRTCKDTLHAVAVTEAAVYAQGHQKCTEKKPGGEKDFASHYGIFALNGDGTLRTWWRSDQPRCVGGKELLVSNRAGFPKGMWSGIDCAPGLLFRPLQ